MNIPLRRMLAVPALAVLMITAFAAPAAAAPAVPDGLSLTAVRQSLLGTHTWYQQTYDGLPVLGGFYVRHIDTRTGAVTTEDGRLAVSGALTTVAAVSRDAALNVASRGVTANGLVSGPDAIALSSDLVVLPGAKPALAWRIRTEAAAGTLQSLVDAGSGRLLRTESLVKEVNGSGRVFRPNAVVTLQNENLTDSGNQNTAAFAAAYQTVTLTQLNSTGKLVGTYANNVSSGAVTSTSFTFNYNRSQVGFEQVMGYYAITSTQEYIHSLGFTNVNNSAQKYRTTGLTDDNSYYDPATDRITFGTGGVDDAEDAEVIWHEYGHAIQDAQVPGFGAGAQSGAIGEGFGDYWAFSMSSSVSANTAVTPLACIADWDSVSYTSGQPHCLRRVDGTKVYPTNVVGEVHDDGEIWSRGLFDIYNALGRTMTDRIVLEAQFNFAPNTTFTAAAQKIVAAAQALYGSAAATACTTALHARGFI